MSRLKNYNQKLLAVLGTLALIFLIVMFFTFIFETILRNSFDDDVEIGILSDDKIEELNKGNKRRQVVSFEMPVLVDTLNSKYIVPVTHVNLNEAEDIYEGLNAMADSKDVLFKGKKDRRYSRQYYGNYINMFSYNQNSGKYSKLFDERVNFNQFDIEYFEDDILLVLKASTTDSFKDGVVNLKDYKNLFVHSFKSGSTFKIGEDDTNIVGYKFLNESKDLIVKIAVDKNNDGTFDSYKEPVRLMKFEYDSKKLVEVINLKTIDQMQKQLEGSN